VRDAIIAFDVARGGGNISVSPPADAETYDGWLSDINGTHVRQEHLDAVRLSAGMK
jgi:hypothetical protein